MDVSLSNSQFYVPLQTQPYNSHQVAATVAAAALAANMYPAEFDSFALDTSSEQFRPEITVGGSRPSHSGSDENAPASGDGIIRNPNAPVAPFLLKTYDLLMSNKLNHILSWAKDGESFTVWEPEVFAKQVLPLHFKHSNWSSFVRQLNTYGFRKVDTDKWVFIHDSFVRGQPDLLKKIIRRKGNNAPSVVAQRLRPEGATAGNEIVRTEVETLRQEKELLFQGMVSLKQQQEATESRLEMTENRLVEALEVIKVTQEKQEETQRAVEKMMGFLNMVQTKCPQVLSLCEAEDLVDIPVPSTATAQPRVEVLEVNSDEEEGSHGSAGHKRGRGVAQCSGHATCSCRDCDAKKRKYISPAARIRQPSGLSGVSDMLEDFLQGY